MIAVLALALLPQQVVVRQEVTSATPYAGEVFTLTVELQVEEDYARDSMVQLFRRELDLPVQLDLPWLQRDDLRVVAGPTPAAEGSSLAVAGEVLRVAEERRAATADGAAGAQERGAVRVLRLQWRLLGAQPGPLELAPATARWAWASDFEQDLLGSRRPVDRQEAETASAALQLEVRALPEEGRPQDFGGAVGRFEVTATATPPTLAAGDSLEVSLRILGDGDHALYGAPDFNALPGFDLLGQLEQPAAEGRRILYELAPRHGEVEELPPLPFTFFDPREERYRTTYSRAIPLEVSGSGAAAEDAAAPLVPALWTLRGHAGVGEVPQGTGGWMSRVRAAAARSGPWLFAVAPALVACALLLLRAAQRRAAHPRRRLRRAARVLEGALQEAAPRPALEGFLVHGCGLPASASADPTLRERLQEAGMHDEEAEDFLACLRLALGRDYGGLSAPGLREEARAWAQRMRRARVGEQGGDS